METKTAPAHLAPYVAAAQGSLTMWPVIGVLAGLFFATFQTGNEALQGLAICLYILGVFGAVFWQAKKTGVQPTFAGMPGELKRHLYVFWIAGTALAVLSVLVAFSTNFIVAGVLVGVAITFGGIAYHLRSRSIVADLVAAS